MTDWEKLKVVDLKEELKSRGIPLTGLKLKQHFIDKLNEVQAQNEDRRSHESEEDRSLAKDEIRQNSNATSIHEDTPTTTEQETVPEQSGVDTGRVPHLDENGASVSGGDKSQTIAHDEETQDIKMTEGDGSATSAVGQLTGEADLERVPDEFPQALQEEERQARDEPTPPPVEAQTVENKDIETDPFLPQETKDISQAHTQSDDDKNNVINDRPTKSDDMDDARIHLPTEAIKTAVEDAAEEVSSTRDLSPGFLHDEGKRKKRSATPLPDSDDGRKRIKTDRESPIPTRRESDALQQVQEATDAAQQIRYSGSIEHSDQIQSADDHRYQRAVVENVNVGAKDRPVKQPLPIGRSRLLSRSSSPSPSASNIPRAIHPATRSLYIRNFKRPLHIPTLRKHILSLAGPADDDTLKIFYLDSIRTHAFITFATISAASRVRNAMHGTRFPNEPMREPLWIDFVPDEKVEAWVDAESGSGGGLGGGRALSKIYEIKYDESSDGIKAIHQPISNPGPQSQRPPIQQSGSNRMVPQDPTAFTAVASGIHPSRASQVPQSPPVSRSRRQHSEPSISLPPSDPGKGFRALDELFSSTAAKPRLYYKLPSKSIVDDRLDMIRALHVSYDHMGKSGDEGMKRYSFEKDGRSGQEAWVDKGPEFGFGRRGQERLTGFSSHYAGGRGRGTFRGSRRGGDSWRGR